MNTKEFAFIICVDNIMFYEECVRYIHDLMIPSGYTVDILSIQEVEVLADGYRAGMEASDAKYKIYLPQDIWITNEHFLEEVLQIFEANTNAGLIRFAWGQNCEVLVSQYDVNWQQVCVDSYETLHYDNRDAWFYDECTMQYAEELDSFVETVANVIQGGGIRQLEEIVDGIRENGFMDMRLRAFSDVMEIYSLEKMSVAGISSEWLWFDDWNAVYEYYLELKFVLLRMALGRQDDRIAIIKQLVQEGKISRDAIYKIADTLKAENTAIETWLPVVCEEEPLVSVLIATYNAEDFLDDTILSVMEQDYENLEIIIVDDASKDGTRAKIESYQDSRIKAIFLERNQHVCNAANVAFREATGKYITLIGHDDAWKKDKIRKQVSFLENHPGYGVCFTWADIVDEHNVCRNEENAGMFRAFACPNYQRTFWLKRLLMSGNRLCAPSACIRKELLDDMGLYHYGLVQLQDYELWLRVLQRTGIYVIQEQLVNYRRFSDNDTNLSAIKPEVVKRDQRETQWIRFDCIDRMEDGLFAETFRSELVNPDAKMHEAILCEKAFLLLKLQNVYASKLFFEIFGDDTARRIMEEQYHFGLLDFYEMNTQPMLVV